MFRAKCLLKIFVVLAAFSQGLFLRAIVRRVAQVGDLGAIFFHSLAPALGFWLSTVFGLLSAFDALAL